MHHTQLEGCLLREERDESEPSSNLLFTGIIEVQAESRSSWTLCQRPLGANPTKQVSTLPELVVEVRVPRGPSAVEGNRELLVVLKALLPHPKTGEHIDYCRLFVRSNAGNTNAGVN